VGLKTLRLAAEEEDGRDTGSVYGMRADMDYPLDFLRGHQRRPAPVFDRRAVVLRESHVVHSAAQNTGSGVMHVDQD
jgi:hypothetical protein